MDLDHLEAIAENKGSGFSAPLSRAIAMIAVLEPAAPRAATPLATLLFRSIPAADVKFTARRAAAARLCYLYAGRASLRMEDTLLLAEAAASEDGLLFYGDPAPGVGAVIARCLHAYHAGMTDDYSRSGQHRRAIAWVATVNDLARWLSADFERRGSADAEIADILWRALESYARDIAHGSITDSCRAERAVRAARGRRPLAIFRYSALDGTEWQSAA